MRWLPLTLLIGCGPFDPYADGGGWLGPALDLDLRFDCELPEPDRIGPNIGDLARDFSLFDQFAYRVNLHDFCEHTVLLTVAELGDEEAEQAILDVIERSSDRLPSERSTPFIALTTWYRTVSGEIPTVQMLRERSAELGLDPVRPMVAGTPTAMIRDAQRFPGAAAAASAQWIATDVEGELSSRGQIEREVAGRWTTRATPYFIVLHPRLKIATCGSDPDRHQIIEAVQIGEDLFTLKGEGEGEPILSCSRRAD